MWVSLAIVEVQVLIFFIISFFNFVNFVNFFVIHDGTVDVDTIVHERSLAIAHNIKNFINSVLYIIFGLLNMVLLFRLVVVHIRIENRGMFCDGRCFVLLLLVVLILINLHSFVNVLCCSEFRKCCHFLTVFIVGFLAFAGIQVIDGFRSNFRMYALVSRSRGLSSSLCLLLPFDLVLEGKLVPLLSNEHGYVGVCPVRMLLDHFVHHRVSVELIGIGRFRFYHRGSRIGLLLPRCKNFLVSGEIFRFLIVSHFLVVLSLKLSCLLLVHALFILRHEIVPLISQKFDNLSHRHVNIFRSNPLLVLVDPHYVGSRGKLRGIRIFRSIARGHFCRSQKSNYKSSG